MGNWDYMRSVQASIEMQRASDELHGIKNEYLQHYKRYDTMKSSHGDQDLKTGQSE